MKTELHGKLRDGREARLFTLANANGLVARITEYGAILDSFLAPDRDGNLADLTHGYDSLAGWEADTFYFGATVGRYGNRIAGGTFNTGGREYSLATNNSPGGIPCHLHGGNRGFNKVLWKGTPVEKNGSPGVELAYTSGDGEEGYPGKLAVTVTYWLSHKNELTFHATASTDKATPVNIIHHSYWNLSGNPSSSINGHTLRIEADHYLPVNPGLIPTGEIAPVKGTPMDFTRDRPIGQRLDDRCEILKFDPGYDHCWVLREAGEKGGVRPAATLRDPGSGRVMEVRTDQPGIQFYGGNFLDGKTIGKNGLAYPHRSACCLETQLFPDSPNQPAFPNSILRPGESYTHTMTCKFSTR